LGGHKFGGMKSGVSTFRSSTVNIDVDVTSQFLNNV